jgi:hypothetical protein
LTGQAGIPELSHFSIDGPAYCITAFADDDGRIVMAFACALLG